MNQNSKNIKIIKETPLTKEYFDKALDKALNAKFDEKLSNYPTKTDLKLYMDEKLSSYPTKPDLKVSINEKLYDYPTKKDLQFYLAKSLLDYATKADLIIALNNQDDRFDRKIKVIREDIMQFKDDMVSMFLDLKTEIISMKSL